MEKQLSEYCKLKEKIDEDYLDRKITLKEFKKRRQNLLEKLMKDKRKSDKIKL